jgi:hypothetical protein
VATPRYHVQQPCLQQAPACSCVSDKEWSCSRRSATMLDVGRGFHMPLLMLLHPRNACC